MEEEDDEIHSQPALPSPPGNGARISVTVASSPPQKPQQPPPPPPPQPTTTQKSSGGGREDCWSEGATGVLIDAWGERYLELSRGNLKQKHWKEVAEIVSSRDNRSKAPKTDIQCKNRIDTVKKKYKLEKARIAGGGGGGASKWVFFDKLDRLIGLTAKISKIPTGIPVRASSNANFNASNRSFDRKNQMGQLQIHKKRPLPQVAVGVGSSSSEEEEEEDAAGSPESADSLPPPPPPPSAPVKKRRTAVEAGVARERGKWRRRRKRSDGVRELTQAVLRFGEMYEKTESAKLTQVVEMEKQRMKFVKELELQRMDFFINTHLEISQLKVKGTRRRTRTTRRRGGNSNGNRFHNCNNDVDNDNNNVNDNNSDSR